MSNIIIIILALITLLLLSSLDNKEYFSTDSGKGSFKTDYSIILDLIKSTGAEVDYYDDNVQTNIKNNIDANIIVPTRPKIEKPDESFLDEYKPIDLTKKLSKTLEEPNYFELNEGQNVNIDTNKDINIKKMKNDTTEYIKQANILDKLRFSDTKNELFEKYNSENKKYILNVKDKLYDNITNVNASNKDINDNLWIVKNIGYSDIYNHEDNGSHIISNLINFGKNKQSPDIHMIDINQTVANSIYNKTNENNNNTENNTNTEKQVIKKIVDNTEIIIPLDITHNDITYNLLGVSKNDIFNHYYLIYENKIRQVGNITVVENLEFLNFQLYTYILVKIINNKPFVFYVVPARDKININDTLYIYIGDNGFIGPMDIKEIKN